LIFAVHPVTVESVAWISELKNTLSLPPLLLAMGAWVDYEERGSRKDYFLALGLFLVAMLCKTSMVMFPIVILLFDWWKRGRIGWKDLKASLPFFVISLGLGLITLGFLHQHADGLKGVVLGGFFSRLALAGVSLAFYFSLCVWPVGLAPIYPRWAIDSSPIQFLPWVILAGLLYWFWIKRGSWGRHALLGLGFFLINLAPFLGFVAGSYMGFTWVMDHLLYLPIIGLIGLMTAGLGEIEGKLSGSLRPFVVGAVAVMAIGMAWETHAYSGTFAHPEKLWAYTIQRNPGATVPRLNLGMILLDEGRLDEAIEQFQEILRMEPGNTAARADLGLVFMKKGSIPEAIQQYEEALRLQPDSVGAHCNLGSALLQADRFPEAAEQYESALKLDPDNVTVLANLGYILDQEGKPAEAISRYERALQIKPDDALTHNNLGNTLGHVGRIPEAIEHYELSLKGDPENAETHANLGIVLLHAGRLDEAIEHFKAAVKIKPDFATAYNNLGFALMRKGHLSEAIEPFEKAISSNPNYVQAHNNLGGILFQTGRVAEAIEQYELSLKINPNDANARNQLTRLQGLQKTAPTGTPSAK